MGTRHKRKAPARARLTRRAAAQQKWRPRAIPRVLAARIAEALCRALAGPRVRAEAVGSVRRGAAVTRDLDVLLVARRAGAVPSLALPTEPIAVPGGGHALIVEVYTDGPRRRSAIVQYRRSVKPGAGRPMCCRADFFAAKLCERPFALFHYTGSARYNIRVRARAKKMGLLLNQYGLFYRGTPRRRVRTPITREEHIAKRLGISWRLPAARVR
jgi:DNA polymerase/3'-5' exonuclease PolX